MYHLLKSPTTLYFLGVIFEGLEMPELDVLKTEFSGEGLDYNILNRL